jgi:hypothetical protein
MQATRNLLGYLRATDLEIKRRQQSMHDRAADLRGRYVTYARGEHLVEVVVTGVVGTPGHTSLWVTNSEPGNVYQIGLSRVLMVFEEVGQ